MSATAPPVELVTARAAPIRSSGGRLATKREFAAGRGRGGGADGGPIRDVQRLVAVMTAVARRRYRLSPGDADDAVQSAFVTFLEIRGRFPRKSDHAPVLVGILKKKCLEHINRTAREARRLAGYCAKPDAARENAWIRPGTAATSPSTLDVLVRRESRVLILDALRSLKPSSRRLARLITWREFGRGDLVRCFAVNENTLDSRLRAFRAELRGLLEERGLTA